MLSSWTTHPTASKLVKTGSYERIQLNLLKPLVEPVDPPQSLRILNAFKMAISLSYFPILSALLLIFISIVTEAATVTYDFNITWVRANPDGLFERPTIGINGQWPLPVMKATIGDQVVVNVDNQLGNQSTTLHFHGLFQNGTTEMDGPAQVSQCAIPAGSQFTYNFTVSPLADAKWFRELTNC